MRYLFGRKKYHPIRKVIVLFIDFQLVTKN